MSHIWMRQAHCEGTHLRSSVLRCVAVCCSVLQCVAVWCSVLLRVAVESTNIAANLNESCPEYEWAILHVWMHQVWMHHAHCKESHLHSSVLRRVAVCCSVLQCVAACVLRCAYWSTLLCCSVLQRVAVFCRLLQYGALQCVVEHWSSLQCIAVHFSVLHCVAVWCCVHIEAYYKKTHQSISSSTFFGKAVKISCCSMWQCVAVCCSVLQCIAVCCSVWLFAWAVATVCCSALQCAIVCCSVLQCVFIFYVSSASSVHKICQKKKRPTK